MIRFFTVFTFILLLSTNSFSTERLTDSDADQRIKGASEIWYASYGTSPHYIKFRSDFGLEEVNALAWLKDEFELASGLSFVLIKSHYTEDGMKHAVYGMALNDVPFEFMRLTIHSKSGLVSAISGNILNQSQISNIVTLNETEAVDNALTEVGASVYKWQMPDEEKWLREVSGDQQATFYPKPELVIVARNADYKKLDLRYAYKMNVYAHQPYSSQDLYIDAQIGDVLFKHNAINEADSNGLAQTAFSGMRQIKSDYFNNKFFLRENSRGEGIHTWNLKNSIVLSTAVDFEDEDNNWQFLPGNLDAFGTDAHWGAEITYDYLHSTLGRNSINDSGFALNSYVHYGEAYNNAKWDRQLKIMMFGDGSSNLVPLTTLDIVGHEIGHGLTQFTADLIYQDESGAINESFSDILGNCVEYFGKPGSASWRIGEDMGYYFRDMSFPNAKDHPDTYKGNFWYTGSGDNGGVHVNSGVQNYWFYLLSNGGNGKNDFNESYDVDGIGIINAALIAYRTLNVYLTPTSDYEEVSYFSTMAAVDIFGNCSSQHEATVKAWNAVGLNNNYIDHTIASFAANQVDYCNYPFTIQFRNESVNGRAYLWDFGDGTTLTEESPAHTYSTVGQYNVKLIVDGDGCGVEQMVKNKLVTVYYVDGPDAISTDIFKGDSVVLTASSALGEVRWYNDEAATGLLAKGNTYQTPKLLETTTYYLKTIVEGRSHVVGEDVQENASSGQFSNLNVGLLFTTYQNVSIHSFMVNAKSDGERTFTIKDDQDQVIFEKSVVLHAGIQEVILDANVPIGSDFKLTYSGAVKELRMGENTAYPYDYSGLISITGNTMDLENVYPYFFNMNVIEQDCESELKELTVSVEDIKTIKKPPYKFYVQNAEDFNYFIDFFFRENTRIQFGLYGINGQLISEQTKEYLKGSTTEDMNRLLNLNANPSGVYFITITGGGLEKTEKIVNKGGTN